MKRRQDAPVAPPPPVIAFESSGAWGKWLHSHHASSRGVWLKLAKKVSGVESVTYAEALLVALEWGWIDGQKKPLDHHWWLQKFTPRGPRSGWSKINRTKAEELIATGKMKPAGLAEVNRAKEDGRWDVAYDSPRNATVPEDLAQALAAVGDADEFFKTLDAANRYAVLYRIQTAKKPQTRADRIAKLAAMLGRHETIHPMRRRKTGA